MVILSAELTLL